MSENKRQYESIDLHLPDEQIQCVTRKIRRVKYHNLLCSKQSLSLSYFSDDIHFCVYYGHHDTRLANYFEFDHGQKFNCSGQSVCKNNGFCFEDSLDCSKRSVYSCLSCYYRTYYRFSTSGFGLSLNAILGFHVLPNVEYRHQPTIVKVVVDRLNGVLTSVTFQNRGIPHAGCGAVFTIVFDNEFVLNKFIRMEVYYLDSYTNGQDYESIVLPSGTLFREFSSSNWFEYRSMTIRMCRDRKSNGCLVRCSVLYRQNVTSIHDPLHRHLIDKENDEMKQIWCIVRYSLNVQDYTILIDSTQFFVPFGIDFVLTVILITRKTSQQSTVHANRMYENIFREQLYHHQNLPISPIILVLFSLLRIVIYYLSKCLKSNNDSWGVSHGI
ncbi:unnamed protein product [Adineta ricciae]|uniref:Uncharacterized protein n=1 Tax=Adineta ricciae TaxID=249248 RepID=A0A814Q250_ADIRI|nr:unnamed protein product [Adineta ricciae]CAF1208894.1 unnamed protein product [Adineta ricciae]